MYLSHVCVCVRYDSLWVRDYRENLERFFEELRSVLPEECLVVWNLTMPLGKNIAGGFLVPEVSCLFVKLGRASRRERV